MSSCMEVCCSRLHKHLKSFCLAAASTMRFIDVDLSDSNFCLTTQEFNSLHAWKCFCVFFFYCLLYLFGIPSECQPVLVQNRPDILGLDKAQIRIVCAPKIAFIFLPINLNMCFGCSKELSLRDGSFEYPQHMIWLRNQKNNFHAHTLI